MFAVVETHVCTDCDALDNLVWEGTANTLLHSALIPRPTNAFVQQLHNASSVIGTTSAARLLAVLQVRVFDGASQGPCGCIGDLGFALSHSAEAKCSTCGREVVCPTHLMANSRLSLVRADQVSGVPRGVDCGLELARLFGNLLAASTKVSLIDRYAVADCLRAERRTPGSSGLTKLLSAAAGAGVSSVEIFSSEIVTVGGGQLQSADQARSLSRSLSTSATPSVTVSFVPDSSMKRRAHDRWLGFSWPPGGQVTVGLGPGHCRSLTGSQHDATASSPDNRTARPP